MTPVVFINSSETPFVDLILKGLKRYETRTRDTLTHNLFGRRVLIAETGHGRPLIRCSAVIATREPSLSRDLWEKWYRVPAQISKGSRYDWQPGTRKKYAYKLTDVRPVKPFLLPQDARRHGRIWAEYEGEISCLTGYVNYV